mgnify:CR=1 FL=1
MDDEDRPLLRLGLPATPEAVAIQRASMRCIEALLSNGFAMNEVFSVLMTSVWLCGNAALDAGMIDGERERLTAAIRSLADLLDSAAAKKEGKLS